MTGIGVLKYDPTRLKSAVDPMRGFLLTPRGNPQLGLQNRHQLPIYAQAQWRERVSKVSNNIAGGGAIQ